MNKQQQWEANARLIAAADRLIATAQEKAAERDRLKKINAELLAALKDVLNELRKNMPEGDPDNGTSLTDQKIRRFLKLVRSGICGWDAKLFEPKKTP